MGKEKRRTPEDPFAGLTDDEKRSIEMVKELMLNVWGDTPESRKMIAFNVEHERLSYLMQHALKELEHTDPALRVRIMAIVKADYQQFLDAIQAVEELNIEAEHLVSEQIVTPSAIRFTSLFTNDGYELRARMITWLKTQPAGKKISNILRQLQKLLPEGPLRKK